MCVFNHCVLDILTLVSSMVTVYRYIVPVGRCKIVLTTMTVQKLYFLLLMLNEVF